MHAHTYMHACTHYYSRIHMSKTLRENRKKNRAERELQTSKADERKVTQRQGVPVCCTNEEDTHCLKCDEQLAACSWWERKYPRSHH